MLDADGDYVIGRGPGEFWINQPQAVAQAIQTRLLLATGEWFLDQSEGTPYSTNILGKGTLNLYDAAIQDRIRETEGVQAILTYSSNLNLETRQLSVTVGVLTIYSQQPVIVPFVAQL